MTDWDEKCFDMGLAREGRSILTNYSNIKMPIILWDLAIVISIRLEKYFVENLFWGVVCLKETGRLT